ncbi:MAG: hypothetical protein ACRD06_04975 [Terriglobia bacterium]
MAASRLHRAALSPFRDVYVPDVLAERVQANIDNGGELRLVMNEAGVCYVKALKTARREP